MNAGPGRDAALDQLFGDAHGILFDLDGVLLDSSEAVHRHWYAFASWQGIDRSALPGDLHGRRAADVIAHVAARLSTPVADAIRWHEALEIADQDGVVTLPGAREVLSMIPRQRWAVVTSGTRKVALARMRIVGLPPPQCLVAADDVAYGKPAPHPYLAAADLLGLPASRCVAVEDSVAGLESARAAGCRLLGVATTSCPALLPVAIVVSDLSEVTPVLRRLRSRDAILVTQ